MTGNAYCNMVEDGKVTPYNCELSDDATEITITAPETYEKGGKSYTFSSWDGCSESNEKKSICKVNMEKNEPKKIKASYKVFNSESSISSKPSVTPETCENPTKEILKFGDTDPNDNYNNDNPYDDGDYYVCTTETKEVPKKITLKSEYSGDGDFFIHLHWSLVQISQIVLYHLIENLLA